MASPVVDSNNSSSTNPNDQADISDHEILSGLFILLIGLIGSPANLSVIYRLVKKKLRKTPEVSRLLLNLAIADTLVTLLYCPVEGIWTFTNWWYGGDFLCRSFIFIRSFATQSSSYIIAVIAYHRYSSIKDPFDSLDSRRRINRLLFLSWIFSAFLASPLPVYHGVRSHPSNPDWIQCISNGIFYKSIPHSVINFISLIVSLFIPLAFISYCYTKIYLIMKKRAKDASSVDQSRSSFTTNLIDHISTGKKETRNGKTDEERSKQKKRKKYKVTGAEERTGRDLDEESGTRGEGRRYLEEGRGKEVKKMNDGLKENYKKEAEPREESQEIRVTSPETRESSEIERENSEEKKENSVHKRENFQEKECCAEKKEHSIEKRESPEMRSFQVKNKPSRKFSGMKRKSSQKYFQKTPEYSEGKISYSNVIQRGESSTKKSSDVIVIINEDEEKRLSSTTFNERGSDSKKKICISDSHTFHIGSEETRRKVLTAATTLVIIHIVSALPESLMSIYWLINPNYKKSMNRSLYHILFFCSYASSAINPYIYGSIFDCKRH